MADITSALADIRKANPQLTTGVEDHDLYSMIMLSKDTPAEYKSKLASYEGVRELTKKGSTPITHKTSLAASPDSLTGQGVELTKGFTKGVGKVGLGMTVNAPSNMEGLAVTTGIKSADSGMQMPRWDPKVLEPTNVSQAIGEFGADVASVALPAGKLLGPRIKKLIPPSALGKLPVIGKFLEALTESKNVSEAERALSAMEEQAEAAKLRKTINEAEFADVIRPIKEARERLKLESLRNSVNAQPLKLEQQAAKGEQSLASGQQRMELAEKSAYRADSSLSLRRDSAEFRKATSNKTLANNEAQREFSNKMSELREVRQSAKHIADEARKVSGEGRAELEAYRKIEQEYRAIATSDAPIADKLKKAKELKAELDIINRQKKLAKAQPKPKPDLKKMKKPGPTGDLPSSVKE